MASDLYHTTTWNFLGTNVSILQTTEQPLTFDQQSDLTKIFVGMICIAVMIIGVPLNILIITCIAVYTNLRQYSNFFIASLASKDVSILLIGVPLFYLDFVKGGYPLASWLCPPHIGVMLSLSVSSVLELMNIAINRYIKICFTNGLYKLIYTRYKTGIYIALSWIIGFSVGLPVSLMEARVDMKKDICVLPQSKVKAVTFCGVMAISCTVTSFCYFKIFKKVYISQQNLHRFREGPYKQACLRSTLNRSLRDVAVFAVYVILYLPFIVINSFGVASHGSLLWDLGKIFSLFNNVSNSIIYGLFNKRLRFYFDRLLRLQRLCHFLASDNIVYPYTVSGQSDGRTMPVAPQRDTATGPTTTDSRI